MRINHICMCGVYTEGWSYQENLLSKYHAKMGNNVTLVANELMYNESGEKVFTCDTDYINKNGVKIIRIKEKNGKPLSKFQRYPTLFDVIDREKPDILFVHGCQFLDANVIVKYKKKYPNVKIYIDNHADFSNSASGWLSKIFLHKVLWRYMAKTLLPVAEKFYGVTPSRVDFLVQMYKLPNNKVELLVMGVDDEKAYTALNPKIKLSTRLKYGISERDFLIVTGGKIDLEKKQILQLMEAINAIDSLKVKLLVFGSVVEELKKDFEELCSSSVKYIGWVDSNDTDKIFAASDLVVFPGRHSVFWEQAAGMGIPMICKYWEGTTHVDVGGNVRFIYNDSAEEMIEILSNIINNEEEYRKMKDVAINKAMKVFSYSEIAKRSLE